jgi:hypothetical protein
MNNTLSTKNSTTRPRTPNLSGRNSTGPERNMSDISLWVYSPLDATNSSTLSTDSILNDSVNTAEHGVPNACSTPKDEGSEVETNSTEAEKKSVNRNLRDAFNSTELQHNLSDEPASPENSAPETDISTNLLPEFDNASADEPTSKKKSNIIEEKGAGNKSSFLANFLYYLGVVVILGLSVLALVYLPSLLNITMPRLSSSMLLTKAAPMPAPKAATSGLTQFISKTNQL